MIGLDILHLPRIQRLLFQRGTLSERFIKRILHPNELARIPPEPTEKVRYVGTRYISLSEGETDNRFAAKEAAYKAFQPDKRLSWKDVEIWKHQSGNLPSTLHLTEGKPYLRLWQGAQKMDYPLSISHEKEYVVAVVMNTPISTT